MAKPKKPTLEERRQSVLDWARKTRRPILVGPIAIELDCSLAEAEALLDGMVDEGLLRRATTTEMQAFDLREGFVPV